MTAMTLHDVWPDTDRPLTVDDLERLPDDGNRYELVNGVLEVSPAATNHHDRVATRLTTLLSMNAPDGLEVVSPMGVNLSHIHQRIPDVAVVPSEWIGDDIITKPPLLVIEVASRSTRLRDRTAKKSAYEAFGIPSYWLVVPDREQPSITSYELRDGNYDVVQPALGEQAFQPELPFPVTIVPRHLVDNGSAWKEGLP